MNREAAKNVINNWFTDCEKHLEQYAHDCVKNTTELVDKIFDSLEKRICKNCEYYTPHKNINGFGKCKLKIGNLHTRSVAEDFGCNRFKEKSEEEKE